MITGVAPRNKLVAAPHMPPGLRGCHRRAAASGMAASTILGGRHRPSRLRRAPSRRRRSHRGCAPGVQGPRRRRFAASFARRTHRSSGAKLRWNAGGSSASVACGRAGRYARGSVVGRAGRLAQRRARVRERRRATRPSRRRWQRMSSFEASSRGTRSPLEARRSSRPARALEPPDCSVGAACDAPSEKETLVAEGAEEEARRRRRLATCEQSRPSTPPESGRAAPAGVSSSWSATTGAGTSA